MTGGNLLLTVGARGDVALGWESLLGCPAKCFYTAHAAVVPAGSTAPADDVQLEPDSQASIYSQVPVIGLDAEGNATAVWNAYQGPEHTGVVRTAERPAGGTWRQTGDLATGYLSGAATDAAGDQLVVWSGDGMPSDGLHASYRFAGGNWSPAATLTTRPDASMNSFLFGFPKVFLDDRGNALVTWGTVDGSLYAATYTRRAHRWSQPAEVARGQPDKVADNSWAALAGDGNAIVMWADTTGALRAALKPAAATTWTAPMVAGTDYHKNSCCADLALANNGHATAIWEPGPENVDTKEIVAAQLGGSGPIITSLAAPQRVRVGASAHFAVGAFAWSAPLAGKSRWTFGDGASATGSNVTHRYPHPGKYTVTVTARDTAGGTTNSSATVLVARKRR